MSKLVAVADTVFPTLEPAREALAVVGAELVLASEPTPEAILEVAAEADAMLVTYGKITAEVIAGLKNCSTSWQTSMPERAVGSESSTRTFLET